MRTFSYAPKSFWIDFLKPIIFETERDLIKRNNFSCMILSTVPPKHIENV